MMEWYCHDELCDCEECISPNARKRRHQLWQILSERVAPLKKPTYIVIFPPSASDWVYGRWMENNTKATSWHACISSPY